MIVVRIRFRKSESSRLDLRGNKEPGEVRPCNTVGTQKDETPSEESEQSDVI